MGEQINQIILINATAEATAVRSAYYVPDSILTLRIFCLASLQQSAKIGIVIPILQVRILSL